MFVEGQKASLCKIRCIRHFHYYCDCDSNLHSNAIKGVGGGGAGGGGAQGAVLDDSVASFSYTDT